jgi:ferritin-like metal-binding protein YciE
MKPITNLNDLFIEQMQEVANAERQQFEILQSVTRVAEDQKLREACRAHHEKTHEHHRRLVQVFDDLDILVSGEYNHAMNGLIHELQDLLDRSSDPEVRYAAIIVSLQGIEHFEIAMYGSLCAIAKALGKNDAATVLHENLEDEKAFDRELSALAIGINRKAVTALVP